MSTRELFAACTLPLVEDALGGSKCTCFAYGQTGSGKTYTLLGAPKAKVAPGPSVLTRVAGCLERFDGYVRVSMVFRAV